MVVTRADRIGGAQVHVRDLSRALQVRGFAVTVVTGPGGPFIGELLRLRIPHRVLPHLVRALSPPADTLALLELHRALRELDPQLVAAHSSKAGWLARLTARHLGIPCVFTVHGWPFAGDGTGAAGAPARLYVLAERLVKGLADRVITVSEHDRVLGLRLGVLDPARAMSIPNGVPDVPPALRADPGDPAGPTRLVMVARFEEPKDHATLLRALARVRRPWQLDLVGDGPLQPAVRALARDLGVAGRVRFHGSRGDVARVLAGARLFVLSTRREGMPLAILEAMRAGLPVLASAAGGVPEAVVHGETGFVAPPGDVPAWAGYLERLLADPGLRARLGRAGRRRYEERFTLERMVEQTVAVYETLLAPPAGGAARSRRPGAATQVGGGP
ncbi:MAG: glycosyl transferase family 1 [Bacillota bacterium]|nr:MAG: glycosyl transferase family 1 [Bacillota bacterium]